MMNRRSDSMSNHQEEGERDPLYVERDYLRDQLEAARLRILELERMPKMGIVELARYAEANDQILGAERDAARAQRNFNRQRAVERENLIRQMDRHAGCSAGKHSILCLRVEEELKIELL